MTKCKLKCPLFIYPMLLFCSLCAISFGQISDDFSDDNFTSNPLWTGDDIHFIINSNAQLQLNGEAAGQSNLATTFPDTDLANKEWRFYVKQTFDGSSSNQSRIYFVADGIPASYSGDGSAGVQGYYLRLGESGSADVIRVFRDNGSSTAEIAAGVTSTIPSFATRIRIRRDAVGIWEVAADFTGGDTFAIEANFTDATYNSTSAFGIICSYTLSNATKFYFDDIYFGNYIIDQVAPTLLSAIATSSNNIDLLFDEVVNEVSSETLSNYNVAGLGNPTTATRDITNQALVHLTFAAPFPENITQSIQVNNVTDLEGNPIVSSTLDFIWFVAIEPYFRAVVFNEILADETPPIGLPAAEFVELLNNTAGFVNLSGWKFINSTTIKILPSYILNPGESVILCDDDSQSLFNNAIGIPSFSALSNSGDSLTLLDNANMLIDILDYSIDWYESSEKADGGWSLEQINPNLPCPSSGANWHESLDIDGGTPGSQNSVYNPAPDNIPPAIIAKEIINPQLIAITFSELMDTSAASQLSFNIIPFNSTTTISWDDSGTILYIGLALPLISENEYSLTVEGLKDCSGNTINTQILTFLFGKIPEPGELIISEIYPDESVPESAQVSNPMTAEFVELYNKSEHILELTNVTLNGETFDQPVIMQPYSYLVVGDADHPLSFLAFPNKALMSGFNELTNSLFELVLANGNGVVLDELIYNLTWYHDNDKNDGGFSLELINPEDPCSASDNWTASNDPSGSTPGSINSVYSAVPDTLSPQILYTWSEPQDSLTLIFNEPLDPSSELIWKINGELLINASAEFTGAENNIIQLPFGSMLPGVVYNLELAGIKDCWGNISSSITTRFAMAEDPQPGDILVNEILFDPFETGRDFIEIYNHSMRNISLKNFQIADETNDEMNGPKVITERQMILYPGEYLALAEAGNNLTELYPKSAGSPLFEIADLPDFSSTDEVYLLMPNDSNDVIISDRVPYDVDMHYPLLDITKGVSLERIAFERPSMDRTNWHSASDFVGFATPGYRNSQSESGVLPDGNFVVEPEIFSPDNDGFKDVVTFAYQMDDIGYTGNIKIFDSEGRLVRHLMKSELLGTAGNISWDGFSDENQKASIGIYVVFFESFNPNGNTTKTKKTCVLAHSLN